MKKRFQQDSWREERDERVLYLLRCGIARRRALLCQVRKTCSAACCRANAATDDTAGAATDDTAGAAADGAAGAASGSGKGKGSHARKNAFRYGAVYYTRHNLADLSDRIYLRFLHQYRIYADGAGAVESNPRYIDRYGGFAGHDVHSVVRPEYIQRIRRAHRSFGRQCGRGTGDCRCAYGACDGRGQKIRIGDNAALSANRGGQQPRRRTARGSDRTHRPRRCWIGQRHKSDQTGSAGSGAGFPQFKSDRRNNAV